MQRCSIHNGTLIIFIWSIMWKILSFFLLEKCLILINSSCFPAIKCASHFCWGTTIEINQTVVYLFVCFFRFKRFTSNLDRRILNGVLRLIFQAKVGSQTFHELINCPSILSYIQIIKSNQHFWFKLPN